MWIPFDEGKTLSCIGSENGIILKDDEETSGARITLEKNGKIAPFSITCGVYGLMCHTAFASNEKEAIEKYEEMKMEITEFMNTITSENDDIKWCEVFTNKY